MILPVQVKTGDPHPWQASVLYSLKVYILYSGIFAVESENIVVDSIE